MFSRFKILRRQYENSYMQVLASKKASLISYTITNQLLHFLDESKQKNLHNVLIVKHSCDDVCKD